MSVKVLVRGISTLVFFLLASLSSYISIIVGFPLGLINSSLVRAWFDLQKANWSAMAIIVTQVCAPLRVKIYSRDPSVRAKFVVDKKADRIVSRLNPRAVVISNHQLYSDWVYLWWLAYTSGFNGALVIALKASLGKIPVFGWAMRHWNFLLLSRKWKEDEKAIASTMNWISSDPSWPTWLVLFPEGTVFNTAMSAKSKEYYERPTTPKTYPHPKHMLLPRSTGLQAALANLKGSLPILYDVTSYFPGIPATSDGETWYSLKNIYGAGKGPKEIRMHIREFQVDQIPYENREEFEEWLYKVYAEKDVILEQLAAEDTQGLGGEPPFEAKYGAESIFEIYGVVSVPLCIFLIVRLLQKWLFSS